MRQNAPNPISISFFLHIECVQRISVHIQYAVEHQQYNCNQERIENNQLIGFANVQPNTGILGLPYCNFCAVRTIPKTISTRCHFVVNVKSVCNKILVVPSLPVPSPPLPPLPLPCLPPFPNLPSYVHPNLTMNRICISFVKRKKFQNVAFAFFLQFG